MTARGAILGGALDRKLLKKELRKDGQIVESEDEETSLNISFDGLNYVKVYRSEESFLIPWTDNNELLFNSGELIAVVVRARSSVEIQESFEDDLTSLRLTGEKYRSIDPKVKLFYLVPRDFEDIPQTLRDKMISRIKDLGAMLMMSPESVAGLDKEAMRRIETGRMVRHE